MDASQYPVTFPYGATTRPYSPAHPHLGEDRRMPTGVPIIVNGVTIGLSGNTGNSTGAHLHIQKVSKGQVTHPQNGGFTLPSPVTVFETGFNPKIGNFVRLRDAKGDEWSYFHLSEIKVSKGELDQVIINKEQARILLFSIQGKNGLFDPKNALAGDMDADIDKYFAGRELDDVMNELWNDPVSTQYREQYQIDAHEALISPTTFTPLGQDVFIKSSK